MSFDTLGLCPTILAAVKSKGYSTPTPIQKNAIPAVLKGRDVMGGAQTGTGKTAAFTLPLLQMLQEKGKSTSNAPRVLIMAPTRELAAQVAESVEDYGKGLPITSTVIFGGVGIHPQIKRLRKGVDIVIGTPGRLLDLAGQKALNLSKVETLVLDEADRMLDMGFIHDIRRILKLLPQKRQTLFFSATYSREIKQLSDTILRNPELIEVARQNTAAENVDQSVYKVEKSQKRHLLAHLIDEGDWNQVLVFTKTKHGANRLAEQLSKGGISSTAIHGNKSQNARTRALADFKALKVRVLVATDIAARGIDIDKLPHVVNFDLPMVAEDYVHRIGRTGRAGSVGEAFSLVCGEDMKHLKKIERLIKRDIPVKTCDGFKSVSEPKQKSNHQSNDRRRHQGGGGSSKKNNRKAPWWANKKRSAKTEKS